jgi:hypothetical protein
VRILTLRSTACALFGVALALGTWELLATPATSSHCPSNGSKLCGEVEQKTSGVVFIIEKPEPGDTGRFSGRFSAHRESSDGQRYLEGPARVSIREAVTWGRSHAPVVYVFVGDDDVPYSAGREKPRSGQFREWPRSGVSIRSRPVGTPLDGSQQERSWLVRSVVKIPRGVTLDQGRIEKQLDEELGVSSVTSQVRNKELIVECRVAAPGMTPATLAVDEAVAKTISSVLGPDGPDPSDLDISTSTVD